MTDEPLSDRDYKTLKGFLENRAFEYRAFIDGVKMVEMFEKAHAEYKALPKVRDQLIKDIADLETRKVESEAKAHGAAVDASRAQTETNGKKEELAKQAAALDKDINVRQQKIAGLDGEFAERLKAKELELQVLQNRVDAMKEQIDGLKRKFAAA